MNLKALLAGYLDKVATDLPTVTADQGTPAPIDPKRTDTARIQSKEQDPKYADSMSGPEQHMARIFGKNNPYADHYPLITTTSISNNKTDTALGAPAIPNLPTRDIPKTTPAPSAQEVYKSN